MMADIGFGGTPILRPITSRVIEDEHFNKHGHMFSLLSTYIYANIGSSTGVHHQMRLGSTEIYTVHWIHTQSMYRTVPVLRVFTQNFEIRHSLPSG
jgi:hypothetical protein